MIPHSRLNILSCTATLSLSNNILALNQGAALGLTATLCVMRPCIPPSPPLSAGLDMIMSDMRGGSGEGVSGEDLEGEQLFAMKVNNKVRQLKSKLIFTLLTVHRLNYLI